MAFSFKDTHVPRNLSILKVKTRTSIMYKSGLLLLISLNLLQHVSGQADGNPHVGSLNGFYFKIST